MSQDVPYVVFILEPGIISSLHLFLDTIELRSGKGLNKQKGRFIFRAVISQELRYSSPVYYQLLAQVSLDYRKDLEFLTAVFKLDESFSLDYLVLEFFDFHDFFPMYHRSLLINSSTDVIENNSCFILLISLRINCFLN